MNYLFLYGAPDNNHAFVNIRTDGSAGLTIIGTPHVNPFMDDLPGQCRGFCLAGMAGKQQFNIQFQPDLVINQIYEPDSHETALVRADVLCEQLGVPVVNNPKHILLSRRDHLFLRLQKIAGLQVPDTLRVKPTSPDDIHHTITAGGLRYPIMIRPAGHPVGAITKVIHESDDLEKASYSYALDGRPYYLTNLVDYASKDGLYRKFRLAVIEGRAYLRDYLLAESWMIHARDRTYMHSKPALLREAENIHNRFDNVIWPRIAPTIKAITAELQLDYFTLDANINPQGEILVFEISAGMDFLQVDDNEPARHKAVVSDLRNHLYNLIMRKAKQPKDLSPAF